MPVLRLLISLVAISAITIAFPASANLPTQTYVFSETVHVDAARAYYDALNMDRILDMSVASSRRTFAERVAREGGDKSEKTINAISRMFEQDFSKLHDLKKQLYIQTYARIYSTDDLNSLIAFLNTPLGKRMVAASLLEFSFIRDTNYDLYEKVSLAAYIRHKQELIALGLTFGGTKK